MQTKKIAIFNRALHDSYKNIAKGILECYKNKKSAIVHFIYYANSDKIESNPEYKKSLENADFLLPDGIAFQLIFARKIMMKGKNFWYFLKNIRKTLPKIPSTNGTDFVPYFLNFLVKKNQKFDISLYGSPQEVTEKMKDWVNQTCPDTLIFAKNGFEEWKEKDFVPAKKDKIHILLVGRGTPLQETWIEKNRELLEKNNYLIISVGGLFEFLTNTEKRAPKWVQKIRCEWLWRALRYPKKNFKKTLKSLKVFVDVILNQ
ncbi:WecB/TagA/CpsF family glycosyltransferase [Candidatus Gracilibacteria bacterium]|nr:WecB/TagA/CpsF family glycosyltransferase [Candidatus Gracilibacteria bacterium]